MFDSAAYISGRPQLIISESFMGYLMAYQPHCMPDDLHVQARWIPAGSVGEGRQFHPPAEGQNYPLQSVLDGYRAVIVEKGGTPEAVRILDQFLRFTDEEKVKMAEKLSKKAAPKADAKDTKGKAAGGAKPKGNPDALKKAREERAAKAQENRKYKHAVKLKDISLREGTWTERMVQIIMGNTTTDDAKAELAKDKEFSDKKLDFTWAEKKGYITF